MGYKKCPICEVNYILDTQDRCEACGGSNLSKKAGAGMSISNHNTGAFFVFQGKTYDSEIYGQFIEAPAKGKNDSGAKHHWERMSGVKIGDFILHGTKGYIVAISIAKSEAKLVDHNYEGQTLMRRVELDTFRLPKHIKTREYKDELLKMQPNLYGPFNKNGDGNQGYLFVIYKEMIDFVLDHSLKHARSELETTVINILKERAIERYEK